MALFETRCCLRPRCCQHAQTLSCVLRRDLTSGAVRPRARRSNFPQPSFEAHVGPVRHDPLIWRVRVGRAHEEVDHALQGPRHREDASSCAAQLIRLEPEVTTDEPQKKPKEAGRKVCTSRFPSMMRCCTSLKSCSGRESAKWAAASTAHVRHPALCESKPRRAVRTSHRRRQSSAG